MTDDDGRNAAHQSPYHELIRPERESSTRVLPRRACHRRERQREGIAKAKAAGVYNGRPTSIEPSRVKELKAQGFRGVRNCETAQDWTCVSLSGARRKRLTDGSRAGLAVGAYSRRAALGQIERPLE